MSDTEDRTAWGPFIERACAAVGVDPAAVDTDLVLGLSRSVAHGGARPMAPVSAFILGLAAGAQGQADVTALHDRLVEAVRTAPRPEAG